MLLWLTLAHAAQPSEGWAVTPELLTEVPVTVAVGVHVDMPERLYASASVGVLPRPYVQLANAVTTALWPESYSEDTATLVEETLARSVVLRTRLGWRPAKRAGFTFGTGLTVLALGGDATGTELVSGVTGQTLPASTDAEPRVIEATSTSLMVDVATGWDIPIGHRGFTLRPSLGWSFTVWARTDLEPAFEMRSPAGERALDALEAEGELYLDQTLRGYVHPPWLGLAMGWRFGERAD